jgi:hypothetical protein
MVLTEPTVQTEQQVPLDPLVQQAHKAQQELQVPLELLLLPPIL